MRVLHVWNIAGVGSILAKYQRKAGHRADVIMRKSHDTLGLTNCYNPEGVLDVSGAEFIRYALWKAADYDVIHIHSAVRLVPKLRLKYPKQKIIYHVHGGEYNGTHERKYNSARDLSVMMAHKVICSTPDLLARAPFYRKFQYLPTPIDREFFTPSPPQSHRVLTFKIRYTDIEQLKQFLREKDLGRFVDYLEVIDRESDPVPYHEMPAFLKQFGFYVDVKFVEGKLLKALSKTGLEALSCGLTVINWKGELVKEFPSEHDAAICSKLTEQFYR